MTIKNCGKLALKMQYQLKLKLKFFFKLKNIQTKHNLCHDPNPRFMICNTGAMSKGHPTYAKPQNGHIKRTI
jgi:hypothetical protein